MSDSVLLQGRNWFRENHSAISPPVSPSFVLCNPSVNQVVISSIRFRYPHDHQIRDDADGVKSRIIL